MTRTSILVISILGFSCAFSCHANAQTLLNPSFEKPSALAGVAPPDDWFVFSSTNEPRITVTMEVKKQGIQSCRFTAQQENDAYQGIAQRFVCTQGRTYVFSVYARASASSPLVGDAYGQISLEWQDANGVEISRIHGPVWGNDLSADRWTKFTVTGTPPEGAYYGVVVVTFFSKQATGFGICYVDDCTLITE